MKIVWRVIPCVAKGLAEGRIVAINTFGIIPYIVEKKKKPWTIKLDIFPNQAYHFNSRAHSSVVVGVWPVTQRSMVQVPLWSLDFLCCALNQGTLSILPQSTELKLDTGICWELTCDFDLCDVLIQNSLVDMSGGLDSFRPFARMLIWTTYIYKKRVKSNCGFTHMHTILYIHLFSVNK